MTSAVADAPVRASPDADVRSGASASPLRVALVTGSYNYIRDGVALTLNRLVGHLLVRGVEVLVFAPVGPRPAFEHVGELVPAPSIPVPLRPEYRLTLGLDRALRRRLEAFAPDIVHVATPDLLGQQAAGWARAAGLPVIASYHTRYDTYLKYYGLGLLQPLAGRLERRFYDGCALVLAPTPSMVESLRDQGLRAPLRIWSRGVDTALFSPARRSPAWRAARGVGAHEVVVAFVSRLVREKRLDDFAEVVERLEGEGRPVRALVVGDGPERAALQARLPRAIFEGFVTGEALACAYAGADVFLFPSDTETFGAVTLEAMASGLPAVCADATGSRSLVVEGATGFLAPVGDVETLAARTRSLVDDPALRQAMGAAGRARSLGFSWEIAMESVLLAYREVLAGAGAGRA